MLRLIFVGRLSAEKGFEEVLRLCDWIERGSVDISVDIFGDGEMRHALEVRLSDWSFVSYHGHQPKEKVLERWKSCDYTLMPSHFLETFGLSALDSLQLGIPVIAYQKGGLDQFGEGIVSIDGGEGGDSDVDVFGLTRVVQAIVDGDIKRVSSQRCREIASAYSRDVWLEQFQERSGLQPGSCVLIVNDYAVDIGGLENWLGLMVAYLGDAGYEVQWYGKKKKSYGVGRFVDLLMTIGNIGAWFGVKKFLKKYDPDLVWFHSVHRYIGWLPLTAVSGSRQQWMMFHDFGMIHPYPSKVFDVDQLCDVSDLVSFWKAAGKSFVFFPLIFAKYCSLLLIRWVAKKRVNRRFVPSVYMESIVGDVLDERIETFSEFVERVD